MVWLRGESRVRLSASQARDLPWHADCAILRLRVCGLQGVVNVGSLIEGYTHKSTHKQNISTKGADMRRKLVSVVFVFMLLKAGVAGAITAEEFQVRTTQDLLDLCTVSASDPLAQQAIHFCQGYLVGAYHFYLAWTEGPNATERLVCFPASGVTRNEAVAMFVEWVKVHPQYLKELPVETEFRFMTEKWPCKAK